MPQDQEPANQQNRPPDASNSPSDNPKPDNQQQQQQAQSHTEKPQDKKRRFKTLFIILIAFIVVGIISVVWWLYASQFQSTDDATFTGHLHPVAARINGTISRVLVDDNQIVKKGQVLVEIDPRDYQLALLNAKDNLKQAQAQAETAQRNIAFTQGQTNAQIRQAQGALGASNASIVESQHAVDQARHTLQQQQANYQNALDNYTRYKNADPEAISAQQLEAAKTNLQVAQANRDQAQAAVKQSESTVSGNLGKFSQAQGVKQGAVAQNLQVDVVKAQYQNAMAAVATAQTQVKTAELNLSYTHIIAPTDGRIGSKTAEAGQRVQPGEAMMSIVSPDIWVVANFKETQLTHMHPGQLVDIHVDAFPAHRFEGYVQSFSPASGANFALLPPENATGNFTKIVQRIPVKILLTRRSLKGYEYRLAPGMSVEANVHVEQRPRRHFHQGADGHATN